MTEDGFTGKKWQDELTPEEAAAQEEWWAKFSAPISTPEEWDHARECMTRGTVKLWQADVAEAEQAVDDALERGDREAFMHWSKLLVQHKDRLDKAEDDHVNAQLRRLDSDDDDKPEVVEA